MSGLLSGLGGGGGDDDGESSGPVQSFVDWSTRNTDTHVSGTSVSREQAANMGDLQGYDPENFAGVEEYDSSEVDGVFDYDDAEVETEHPDWREDWQDTAGDIDDATEPGSKIRRLLKMGIAAGVITGGLYLLNPLLKIGAAVVGE